MRNVRNVLKMLFMNQRGGHHENAARKGVYREPGEVDRGEPAGFPEVPAVTRGLIVLPAAPDPDVLRIEQVTRVRAARVRAAWWFVAIIVTFAVEVVLVVCKP